MGCLSNIPIVPNVGNVTEAAEKNVDILSNGDVIFKDCNGKHLYILPKAQLFGVLKNYMKALGGGE